MKKNLLALVFLFGVALFACNDEPEQSCSDLEEGVLKNMTGLDGCGWIIQLDDSSRLEPINLNEFDVKLEENKRICIKYHERTDLSSICMIGKIVELEVMED